MDGTDATSDALRAMVDNGALRDICYLISKGIPYDVAHSLEDVDRLAHVIVFGELDGSTWNWDNMRFDDPKP